MTSVSIGFELKQFSPMLVTVLGIVRLVNAFARNAKSPIVKTLEGIDSDVRPQVLKAPYGIEVIPVPITTVVRVMMEEKQPLPNVVTELGIVTLVNAV